MIDLPGMEGIKKGLMSMADQDIGFDNPLGHLLGDITVTCEPMVVCNMPTIHSEALSNESFL